MNKKEVQKPVMIRIEKIVDEAKGFRTFVFKEDLGAKPGQFVIMWIPRFDEKPFSIAYQDKEKFAITINKVGPFTKRMFMLKEGDFAGIRGPYGSSFNIEEKNLVLVGGGCGTAPMAFLADEAKRRGKNVTLIMGAQTKEGIIYLERMKKCRIKTVVTTDDGSFGIKGFTTQALQTLIDNDKVDKVFTCGPEVMMKFIIDICDKAGIPCEVSMERYMKCGLGICGQCCIDEIGERVCKEGPVFDSKKVRNLKEFSKYKRGPSGKKINF
jgi:dihydroorotate dehydrogenase electron transfer subunit